MESLISNKSVTIKTGRDKDILADISLNSKKEKKPLVIFCHGYKGYKDWGAWNAVAGNFAKEGFVFLKFNFSHNGGTLDNPIDFPDLEAFGKNTLSLEVKDLLSVIDWVKGENEFSEQIELSNISLIGHSRGGGIVTLVASMNKIIKNIISWAGVSDFGRWFPDNEVLIEKWKKDGVSYVLNGRTKQQMPHYFSFYEDYIKNKEFLNVSRAASKITASHLIIHGDNDAAVAVAEAQQLAEANPNAEVKIITNGNHTFGSKHPWEQERLPEELQIAVDRTINFIKKSNKL